MNCALWLLDKSGLSSIARSSPIHVVRTMSAMVSNITTVTLSILYNTYLPIKLGKKGAKDYMGLRAEVTLSIS